MTAPKLREFPVCSITLYTIVCSTFFAIDRAQLNTQNTVLVCHSARSAEINVHYANTKLDDLHTHTTQKVSTARSNFSFQMQA